MSKNGWTNHLVTGIGRDDFVTLDEDEALKPRAVDGSLPRRFGRLAADSKLVDAGSADYDVPAALLTDFPFLERTLTGTTRDLGPYERTSIPATAVATPPLSSAVHGQPVKRLGPDHRLVIVRNGTTYRLTGQQEPEVCR